MKKPPIRKSEEQPAGTMGKRPLGETSKIPEPWVGKNVSKGDVNMGQHDNAAHDAHMERAAKHSTYEHHDGKANAPRPFNAQVGGEEDEDEPTTGQETMPHPFNTGKSKDAGRGRNAKEERTRD